MITSFSDYQAPSERTARREIRKLRQPDSPISLRELAKRKRARKIAKASQRRNRRFQ